VAGGHRPPGAARLASRERSTSREWPRPFRNDCRNAPGTANGIGCRQHERDYEASKYLAGAGWERPTRTGSGRGSARSPAATGLWPGRRDRARRPHRALPRELAGCGGGRQAQP
jgi:hypothetical protein